MIVAHMVDKPKLVAPTEATVLVSQLDMIAAVHYKQSVDRDTQVWPHETVERYEHEKLKHYWKDEVQQLEKYAIYRKQVLEMLIEFQLMWDGHLKAENIAKHCIKLTPEKTQPIHLATYQAGQKLQSLKKLKSTKCRRQEAIKSTQTGLAAPIVFTLKTDEHLRFCVD